MEIQKNYLEIAADPDFIIAVGQALKDEQEKTARLTKENAVLTQQVAELKPKITYYDIILKCKHLVPISIIARDYGYDAVQMHNILHDLGVQYKTGGTWLLYEKYAKLGWTSTKIHNRVTLNGENCPKVAVYWTQKGRLGLYHLLKEKGILPTIELD